MGEDGHLGTTKSREAEHDGRPCGMHYELGVSALTGTGARTRRPKADAMLPVLDAWKCIGCWEAVVRLQAVSKRRGR